MAYQIFISYRREGGELLGKILYDRLKEAGYTVFYDVEQMKSGAFNEQLYTHIDGCTDFLLLLSPHALDRCISDPQDWVLREVTRAIEKKKNIIPVVMRDFGDFPGNLPPAIASLPLYERLDASLQVYFDAAFDRLCTRLLHSVPMATAGRRGSQEDNYPVTAEPVMTDTVKAMLRFMKQKNIPFEFFMRLYGIARQDKGEVNAAKDSESTIMGGDLVAAEMEWIRVENSFGFLTAEEKQEHQEKVKLLSDWLLGIPEEKLMEIDRFCREVRTVRSIYRPDGMTFRNPIRQHFTYESSVWDIMDIFELGDRKWIVATSARNELLPEIGIFSLEGGSFVRMAESSQEYLTMLSTYCVSFRLMDLMPEYVKEKLGADNLQLLGKNLASQTPGTDSSWMLDNMFNNNRIYGEYVKKGWFLKTNCLVYINQKYCRTMDPETKQDNRLTQFGKEQAVDIVRVREGLFEEGDYLVLTCPQKAKGMQYYQDSPRVYRVNVSRNTGSARHQLDFTEILPGKGALVEPGALERFSLRMAFLRKMGIVG